MTRFASDMRVRRHSPWCPWRQWQHRPVPCGTFLGTQRVRRERPYSDAIRGGLRPRATSVQGTPALRLRATGSRQRIAARHGRHGADLSHQRLWRLQVTDESGLTHYAGLL